MAFGSVDACNLRATAANVTPGWAWRGFTSSASKNCVPTARQGEVLRNGKHLKPCDNGLSAEGVTFAGRYRHRIQQQISPRTPAHGTKPCLSG